MAMEGSGSASFIQGGGDAIPREYHRKVLKKIAQLTKVIYALNTKNDEHEQFITRLKATHEQDLDKILSDCTHRLQQCKDKLSLDCKQEEEKVATLTKTLAAVEKERNDLIKEQVSYRKTVEERLVAEKTQHADMLSTLNAELGKLRKDQVKQLGELSDFRVELSKRSSKHVEEMEQMHQKNMKELLEKCQGEFSKEKTLLIEEHKREVAALKNELEEAVESCKLDLSRSHDKSIAAEKKLSEERENALRQELAQKEKQVSSLLADLRAARDKLALSEQKVAELLARCEDSRSSSSEIRSQLEESEGERERLQVTLRETKNELEISREHYKQQSSEMKAISAQVSKLEAVCVAKEGNISELQSQLADLKLKIKKTEEERWLLESSKDSLTQHQLAQISALETDLEKMQRQNEELRLQFAREIEAAQAQLGEREAQLGYEHIQALQQLRDENKQAEIDAKREKETALEKLRSEMESEKQEEVARLRQLSENEIGNLRSALFDKTSELELAQEQLKRLEYELSRKEQGMGSVTSSLDKLRTELVSLQGELAAAQRQKEAVTKDKVALQSAVEGLKEQGRELRKTHQAELEKLRRQLTQELDEKWKERLKQECGALRQELSSRYGDDSRAALAELADVKDRAMEKARKKWEAERDRLLKQVGELERRLKETQESSSALLNQANASSESEIKALRLELEEVSTRHSSFMEEQTLHHRQELEVLRTQLTAEMEGACEELRERCGREKQELQSANKLAVEALREVLEQQYYQQLEQASLEHASQREALREELLSRQEGERERLEEQHRLSLQKQQDKMEKMMAERKNEVTHYERAMEALNSDMNSRNAELGKLRDKVNTLTVGMNNLRKELEVKGQEVLMVRREANAILQQRIQEVSAAHSAELESMSTQHKYQSQMLITDFDKAKAIFADRISELEMQVSEWEHRYRVRESKPEDLEAIRQLRLLTEQQKQKMKDLIAEKRVYQLELVNREKNYNQIFNANPCVGVLNPLNSKRKGYDRFPSAPSLVTPTESHPGHSSSGPLLPLHPPPMSTHSTGQLFSRREPSSPPPSPVPHPPNKPKRFVTLKDSPLNSRHKVKDKNGPTPPPQAIARTGSDVGMGPPIKQIETDESQKHSMTVQ